jgi:hypothetical protein
MELAQDCVKRRALVLAATDLVGHDTSTFEESVEYYTLTQNFRVTHLFRTLCEKSQCAIYHKAEPAILNHWKGKRDVHNRTGVTGPSKYIRR